MNEPLILELSNALQRYLASQSSLSEFRDWFDAATWNLEETDILLQQVIGEIELRLAEFSNGHWSESELRERFIPLLTVAVVSARPLITTGVSNVTSSPATDPRSGFGIQFAEATLSGVGSRT